MLAYACRPNEYACRHNEGEGRPRPLRPTSRRGEWKEGEIRRFSLPTEGLAPDGYVLTAEAGGASQKGVPQIVTAASQASATSWWPAGSRWTPSADKQKMYLQKVAKHH